MGWLGLHRIHLWILGHLAAEHTPRMKFLQNSIVEAELRARWGSKKGCGCSERAEKCYCGCRTQGVLEVGCWQTVWGKMVHKKNNGYVLVPPKTGSLRSPNKNVENIVVTGILPSMGVLAINYLNGLSYPYQAWKLYCLARLINK